MVSNGNKTSALIQKNIVQCLQLKEKNVYWKNKIEILSISYSNHRML